VAHLTRVLRGGGTVIAGTDSPIAPNAVSLHYNLRAMASYGMTAREALTTATSMAGDFLGEPVGRIAPGHYADLSLLTADPLADIKNAAAVSGVISNGVPHTVDDLVAPFRTAEGRSATTVRTLPDNPANAGYWWHDPAYLEEAKHACCAGH
jgi:cytosine/adenosine deaminase-related metal-dependent hydrolase